MTDQSKNKTKASFEERLEKFCELLGEDAYIHISPWTVVYIREYAESEIAQARREEREKRQKEIDDLNRLLDTIRSDSRLEGFRAGENAAFNALTKGRVTT